MMRILGSELDKKFYLKASGLGEARLFLFYGLVEVKTRKNGPLDLTQLELSTDSLMMGLVTPWAIRDVRGDWKKKPWKRRFGLNLPFPGTEDRHFYLEFENIKSARFLEVIFINRLMTKLLSEQVVLSA